MRIFVDENKEVSSLLRYHLPQKIFIEKRDVINQVINSSFKKNHFPKTGIFCVWAGWKSSQLFFMEDRKRISFVENLQNGIMDPIQKKITEAYYIDEFFKVPPSKVFDCLMMENGLLDLLDVVIDCKQEMREFFKDLHADIEKRNKKKAAKQTIFR